MIIILTLLSFQAISQRIQEIVVEMDTVGKVITYGSRVNFKFYTINKKGKKKEVEYRKVDQLISINATNAEVSNGGINFSEKSSDKGYAFAKVKFTSTKPDETKLDQEFLIRMNFKSALVLNYKGQKGVNGTTGSSGGIPIVFRDGKPGDKGGNGGDGYPGKNITVRFKREMDDFTGREILFAYVMEDSLGNEYIYRCLYPHWGITVTSAGGDGGDGGTGGSGSRGKHGKKDGDDIKNPGDGGAGGDGGDGGNGSIGGKITIIAHTNCSDLLSYLKIENNGGNGGLAGSGGRGGSAGDDVEGGTSGKSGAPGLEGKAGNPGLQGPPFELRVEEF